MFYPLVKLYPIARRLGQMDADDLRALQKMDPEDLVTLGRIVSCGRIIAQSSEYGLIQGLIEACRGLASDLVGYPEAGSKFDELKGKRSEFKDHGEKDITALVEIARVIVEKQPDWQVSYRKAAGDVQIVASRTGETVKMVSLDPLDSTTGGALRYVRDHQDIVDKLKKAASLGNPGWFLYLLLVIIALALIFIGVVDILASRKQKWEEILIKRIAANEARIGVINEELLTLGPNDPRKQKLSQEKNGLEAENAELRKALQKSQESGGPIEDIIKALGIAPIIQGIVALSGIILVGGLLVWILSPSPASAFAPARKKA